MGELYYQRVTDGVTFTLSQIDLLQSACIKIHTWLEMEKRCGDARSITGHELLTQVQIACDEYQKKIGQYKKAIADEEAISRSNEENLSDLDLQAHDMLKKMVKEANQWRASLTEFFDETVQNKEAVEIEAVINTDEHDDNSDDVSDQCGWYRVASRVRRRCCQVIYRFTWNLEDLIIRYIKN